MITFAREDLKAEFHGETERRIVMLPGDAERIIVLSPRCRAIVVAAAYEVDRIFSADLCVTSVLRDWETEDRIYPERVRLYGAGPQKGKPFGPHLPGRAVDVVPKFKDGSSRGPGDRLYELVMSKAADYLDSYFPYAWNNKSRGPVPFKTALRHTVYAGGKPLGDHLHIQLSY